MSLISAYIEEMRSSAEASPRLGGLKLEDIPEIRLEPPLLEDLISRSPERRINAGPVLHNEVTIAQFFFVIPNVPKYTSAPHAFIAHLCNPPIYLGLTYSVIQVLSLLIETADDKDPSPQDIREAIFYYHT